jgi:CheY-like chemotaxis protein
MQGEIWVESQPGKGSRFHFTARFGVTKQADQTAPAQVPRVHSAGGSRPGSRIRVLLTEDNIVNQRVALRILEKEGYAVVVANNGKEALKALEEQALDVVLMDIQMPEMGGFEATAAIRDRERHDGSHIPIIAMTAHAMAGDRELCLAAGMDDYIAKPVRAQELIDLIEKHATRPVSAVG